MDYAIVVVPLSEEDGGGFIGVVPDLPGCMGDGETREDAVADTAAAMHEWIDECKRLKRDLPAVGCAVKRAIEERESYIKTIKYLVSDNEHLEDHVDKLEAMLSQLLHMYDEDVLMVPRATILQLTARREKRISTSC